MSSRSTEPNPNPAIKIMRLRYSGTCGCGNPVSAGARAGYDTRTRAVICPPCLEAPESVSVDGAAEAAGASLRRTYEQRVSKREDRIRNRFPRIGGLLLAVTSEPPSTTAFKKGAEGEVEAARRLIKASGSEVMFLLNRRLGPGRRDGDIDMIAINPQGVLIIDVKHYKGARVEVRHEGGLWKPRVDRLFVGGRDKSAWLASMSRQREAVSHALGIEFDDLEVSCAFCFVDAELPLFGKLTIADIAVCGARELGKALSVSTGKLDMEQRNRLYEHLSARLPAA